MRININFEDGLTLSEHNTMFVYQQIHERGMEETRGVRGFQQWIANGRRVKKGAKAIKILKPRFADKDEGEGCGDIKYFTAVPVFVYEDTEPIK